MFILLTESHNQGYDVVLCTVHRTTKKYNTLKIKTITEIKNVLWRKRFSSEKAAREIYDKFVRIFEIENPYFLGETEIK